jgi:hypothetical protein
VLWVDRNVLGNILGHRDLGGGPRIDESDVSNSTVREPFRDLRRHTVGDRPAQDLCDSHRLAGDPDHDSGIHVQVEFVHVHVDVGAARQPRLHMTDGAHADGVAACEVEWQVVRVPGGQHDGVRRVLQLGKRHDGTDLDIS